MRHYEKNSPEASARILALALMVDGAIDLREAESLQRHRIIETLDLSKPLFDQVVREFCEDVLAFAGCTPSGRYELDAKCIGALLQEIHDPLLQSKLFSAILHIVNAEGQVLGSEAVLLTQAVKVWSLDRDQYAEPALTKSAVATVA